MKVIMSVDIECQFADAARIFDEVSDIAADDAKTRMRGIHPAPNPARDDD